MIVDAHSHIFPYLGSASSYNDSSTHLIYFQKAIGNTPATAVRKVEDGKVTKDFKLWDDKDPSPKGRRDVKFRVGKYGRFEWTEDVGDVYVHLYPPSLQDMTAPPEFMLAQMDYAGIDVAVLQNAWLYGQLNNYFADAVKQYPKKLIGTAQVKEVVAYQDDQIALLRHAVKELGLTGGLYFSTLRFFENNFQDRLDDKKFFPFWEEVRSLGIPVLWDISSQVEPGLSHLSPLDRYLIQMKRFLNWLDEFPEIPSILVHGVQLTSFCDKDTFIDVPDEVWKVWRTSNVYLEILFPIQVSYPRPNATVWDYPFVEARPMIKKLYQELGAEKLLWGSDMPNVERNCTYKQSLEYLTRYCTFIPSDAMEKIIGGNAKYLFGIDS